MQEDPSLGFLQQPHTLAMLVFLIGGIAYVALYLTDDVDRSENIKWGLFAAVVVFLLYGMVQFRDGPFVRPHPVVWRAVLALSIAYELFLVWLMFQKLDDARQLFKFINPALGVPLAEKQYAQNCDITFDTMRVRGLTEDMFASLLFCRIKWTNLYWRIFSVGLASRLFCATFGSRGCSRSCLR